MHPLHPNADVAGPGGWRIDLRPARCEGGLPAFVVVPDRLVAGIPPIVAVHGISRNAREQATLLAREAAARGHIVIAPHFEEARWPRYQQVVRSARADLAMIALLDDVRADYPIIADKIVLSGFSGGAQFAHRFAMLHPERVARLIATAAGWYTFPGPAPFPYGLGDKDGAKQRWGAIFANRLDRFLRLPIAVAAGAFDDAPDMTLRRSDRIDPVQGIGRLTRAGRWVDALRAAAHERGIEPQISRHVLDECAHDFAMCVRIGGLDRLIVAPRST